MKIPFLPAPIAQKGIAIYIASLALVSVFFYSHIMPAVYMVMGLAWVTLFFGMTAWTSNKWFNWSGRRFTWVLLAVAVAVRAIWVGVSFFFYTRHTGLPFEFEAADSIAYHDFAVQLSEMKWGDAWRQLFRPNEPLSDTGYFFYLEHLYRLIGPSIVGARLVKCLWGALTCWLLYRLTARTTDETTGRLAGIMAGFMPNLIIYCGLHLKETEMILLTVAFLERCDSMLRKHSYDIGSVALPLLLGVSLFTFRTVLGSAAVVSLIITLLFANRQAAQRPKRFVMAAGVTLAIAILAGSTIAGEVEDYWQNRSENQVEKRYKQTMDGNLWAQYATGTVMMPLMVVMPFPTMIDIDLQHNQNVLHGGNYVRNFLGCFVLIAFFHAFFRGKDWRNKLLPLSFVGSYLCIIALSGYANSERFVLPALPLLLLFAADGVALLNEKNYSYVKLWYWLLPVMAIAWTIFKMGSRGIL